jgi:CDP-diacylglycerol--glycerol-3-phosphate 3-phosphatidyltransferase
MADKLLSTIAIVLLVSKGYLATYLGALLICREVAISGLRLAAREDGISLQVSDWGKLKTLVLDLSLFCLFINTEAFRQFGLATAWLALGISYFSAYQYISKFLVQAKA